MEGQLRRVDQDRVKQAVAAASPQLRVARFSKQSVPSEISRRPKMEDIRSAPRLSGPVEEVAALTLTEFRRLSKDAKQAVTKILDKVDLLEQQGYEQKIAAIKAWRGSPLNRQYLQLTREGLPTGEAPSTFL